METENVRSTNASFVPEGVKEQDVAAPDGHAGEKAQDVAAPAETNTDAGKEMQPADERAKYAAARRRAEAERDEAVRAAKEQSQTALSETRERLRRAESEQARAEIDRQISEIHAIDPRIRTMRDLLHMQDYDRFYDLVRRGLSLTDAYKLTNMDEIVQRSSEKARQAALTAANGKQHLTGTRTRAESLMDVPQDIVRQYRALNPDATDAEIRKHYNKNRRQA